ncbi:unnamed protein product [Camellia sinensis]
MRKVAIIVMLLCSIAIAMPVVHGIAQGPKAVDDWFQKLSFKKEKLTKLNFYLHDTLSGKNPTAIKVAQANMTFKSPTLFGLINMIDDPLTVGPEPNSTEVGRAQGFYGSAGLDKLGLIMTMNLYFTTGKYNGSTLSAVGRNAVMELYREMPIIGGSGVFRLARGIVTAKTYFLNTTTGDAVVEYNVDALHYCCGDPSRNSMPRLKVVVGPICRTVSDSVYVLDAIVGFDPHDAVATRKASKYIPHGGYVQFLKANGLRGKRSLEKIDEYGQDLFFKAEKTIGMGELEKKALGNLTEASKKGLQKLMKDNILDALVTPFVPAGYDHDERPFGICFGGLKGFEPKLIEITYSFEQAMKIRKPPLFGP